MTMPSGKKTNKLDMPVPGQSLTKPKGEYPWEQPPMYTSQEDAMGYMMSKISTVDSMSRIIAALEEGITVREMVKAFILTGFSEGKFNPNLAELIREDLVTFVKIIAEKAEIEYTEGSRRNQDLFYDTLNDLKENKKDIENKDKELVDIIESEEPKEMLKTNNNSLMSRV
jgi:hypothetical protein